MPVRSIIGVSVLESESSSGESTALALSVVYFEEARGEGMDLQRRVH